MQQFLAAPQSSSASRYSKYVVVVCGPNNTNNYEDNRGRNHCGTNYPPNSYICFIALIGLRGMFLAPPILLGFALYRRAMVDMARLCPTLGGYAHATTCA